MILVDKLRGEIKANGYTQEQLAKAMGVTPKTLTIKLQKGVFGSDEIEKLVDLLHIEKPWDIFFAKKVS